MGAFSLIMGRETSMYFGSLFMSYEINCLFYRENTKFSELNSFYCIQWPIWNEKLHWPDLLIKYEKWGEYWFKYNENWDKQVLLMPFWTKLYFSWPHIVIIHYKVYQMQLLMCSCSSWTCLLYTSDAADE